MFVVVQEVQLKKFNRYGACRELKVYSTPCSRGRTSVNRYSYRYTGERFERPNRSAYKISIHESKRINGIVSKRQLSVATIDYYRLAVNGEFSLILNRKLEDIAGKLQVPRDEVYRLLKDKLLPLQQTIQREFKQTEEGQTRKKHSHILDEYSRRKTQFAKDYGTEPDDYDFCYDVFGNVMNREYLYRIIAAYRARTAKEETRNDGGYTTRIADEKSIKKIFFKKLAMMFHPDVNPGADTTREMQVLNKLKEEWGI